MAKHTRRSTFAIRAPVARPRPRGRQEKRRRMEKHTTIRVVNDHLKAAWQCGKRCGRRMYRALFKRPREEQRRQTGPRPLSQAETQFKISIAHCVSFEPFGAPSLFLCEFLWGRTLMVRNTILCSQLALSGSAPLGGAPPPRRRLFVETLASCGSPLSSVPPITEAPAGRRCQPPSRTQRRRAQRRAQYQRLEDGPAW